MLRRLRSDETITRKRPTPLRSATFLDNPEMNVEDEAFWANNRDEFDHDPGPRRESVSGNMVFWNVVRNRVVVEPLVNPPGRNKDS